MARTIVCAAVTAFAAFSARAEIALPPGYTPLEWIESTGNQLVNTEWKASATLRCELDFVPLQISGNIMFGTAKTDDDKSPYRFFNHKDGYIFDIGTGSTYVRVGWNSRTTLKTDGTRYLLKVGVDDNKYSYAEATTVKTGDVYDPGRAEASNANPESEDIHVFGGYIKGVPYLEKMRLYGLKMSDIKPGESERSLVRDFVPCRNDEGVAGIWDAVEGRFHADCAGKGVRFRGSDEIPGCVEYIESTGSQLLNTTWKASATLRCELDFAPLMQSGAIMFGTGKDHEKSPYRFFNHQDGYIFDIGTGSTYVRVGRDKTKKLATNGTRYLLKIGVDDNHMAYADASNVVTGAVLEPTRMAVSNAKPESEDIYVFGGYAAGVLYREKMRLYGLKMYDIKAGDTERSLVRNIVPYRFADGTFGAYDLVNDTPYTGAFSGSAPYAYDFEGEDASTLVAHEGVVPSDLFANRTLIAKASPYEADFSTIMSYPALDLRKGTLSVQDDAATTYTVEGTMKVAGGTRLKIDLTADGCDRFIAQTLDFSALSAESPLLVVVRKSADLTELASEYVVAEGAGVADGPLATVIVKGNVPGHRFEMRGGQLVMVPDQDVPASATWKGGAMDDLAVASNWTCVNAGGQELADVLPTDETEIVLPDGCVFNCPKGTPFAHGEIVFPASIGGDCDWTGLAAPINTTIDLKGHRLYVSELKGTGTITDTTALGENLIQDGSFENVKITGNSGNWGAYESAYWKATGSTGVSKVDTTRMDPGSGIYNKWPWSDKVVDGEKVAYIPKTGGISQSVTITEDGDYVLTYSYASRYDGRQSNPTHQYGTHKLFVRVDDETQERGLTSSGDDFAVNMVVLRLTAGEHAISFVGNNTDDCSTILDAVSLRKVNAGGELHVVVPKGETTEWTSVTIKGALKFVKEGEGTYLASNKNGTDVKTWYLCGTSVREGCYKVHPPSNPDDYDFFRVQQLGAQGTETTVEEGAVLDSGGNYNGRCYTIVLNGGTFGNMSTYNSAQETGVPSRFRLTADSFIEGPQSNVVLGDTDLGGHTLTITTGPKLSFFLESAVRNGTLVSNGGRFWTCAPNQVMSDVDLVLNSPMSCSKQTATFRNLTMTYTGTSFGHGANYFCVSGTYKPISDQIWRFKLLDGATIDLSGRTVPLDIEPDANGLFFDANAKTIYVSAVGDQLRSSERVLAWKKKPNVKFRPAPGTTCGFVASESGLYVVKGLTIIIR